MWPGSSGGADKTQCRRRAGGLSIRRDYVADRDLTRKQTCCLMLPVSNDSLCWGEGWLGRKVCEVMFPSISK